MSEVKSIDDLFGELIELQDSAARRAFLDRIGEEDPELCEQLQRLLAAHEQAGSFLQETCSAETKESVNDESYLGRQIGSYKLLQKIGEGGMGTVYMAEQKTPVKRRVALKVIKPGMDSRQVIARFEAERQALAMMDHPNIAKVLEAGTTEEHRPYFVMELVKGTPITEFCDDHRLSTEERLKLFMDVCRAIQHAHQKGIIHRDLKPSNVLVAKFDDQPVVKVIDFGVAKATNLELTERTMFTQLGQIVGTLEYMSPEQAQLNQLDIDTRSDIYSLGVLLYELLIGETPFDRQRLRTAAFDEMLRIIREEEPQRPSLRFRSSQSRDAIAEKRRLVPERLGGLVKGDLDWIVMKALSKQRAERYDSASRFADDVRHYLAKEPVEARSPSIGYRLKKVVQRNKGVSVAAAVFLMLLSVGTAMVLKAWKSESDQRAEAQVLLEENRDYIIERILLKSFEGKRQQVADLIDQQKDRLKSDNWQEVLKGSAAVHSGCYDEAYTLLEPVVRKEPQNIPATALLLTAYLHQGNWDAAMELANRLKNEEPSSDLDELFLGYGLVFTETERSIELLEGVLKKEPTWLVSHALLVDIQVWESRFTGDAEILRGALERARALRVFLPNNPFVLNANLHALITDIEFRQANGELVTQEIKDRAESLISDLAPFKEFLLSQSMPAQYYLTIDDRENAIVRLKRVLERGTHDQVWMAVGGLVSATDLDESLLKTIEATSERTGDLRSKTALAYLLTDIPNRRDEALATFRALADIVNTPFDQYMALYIPLLLGEQDLAIQYAKKWVNEWDSGQSEAKNYASKFRETDLIRIVATGENGFMDSDIRLEKIMSSIMLGLLAVADGNREDAIREFEKSVALPHPSIDYVWCNYFLRKLRDKTSHWPRGNRRLNPPQPDL